MAVGGEEFLRRFLLHVLRVASCASASSDSLANRRRNQLLPLCQWLLEAISHQSPQAPQVGETKLPASWLCPHCGGAMVLIEKFTAQEIPGSQHKRATSLTARNRRAMANRPRALARTLEVRLLTRKQEKQATIPMATRSKPIAQASLLNQAKLDASPVGNQLLPEVRNPIQNHRWPASAANTSGFVQTPNRRCPGINVEPTPTNACRGTPD